MTEPTADAAPIEHQIATRAIDDEMFRIQELHTGKGIINSDRLADAVFNALNKEGFVVTRPQPAPPEGEPDFSYLREVVAATRRMISKPLNCGYSETDYRIKIEELLGHLDRLGLAARPKVEDGEVTDIVLLMRERAEALAANLAEREAELAKVDGFLILGWSIDDALDEHPYDDIGDIARDVQKRHAARQQQKASAEPTESKAGETR